MIGSNMSPYCNVLSTPIEVRDAHRAHKLTMAAVVKIAALEEVAQAEIARRLRDGEDAGLIIAEMVESPERWASLDAILDRLTKALDQASKSFDQIMLGSPKE